MMGKGNLAALFAAASVFAAGSASAQEVTLKSVTAVGTITAFV